MHNTKFGRRGFTLIASLLLLLLLSGLALTLLSMVNTEQRAGGNDLNNDYTYHAAEGGIEKMSSDLGNLYKSIQSPSPAQVAALSNNYPTWDTTVTYPVYNVAATPCSSTQAVCWGQISAGPNYGLYAQIIPVTMNVEAQRLTGETVSMTRTAEVALIPVFQFGVFSDSDLFFGRSPNLGFAGRVHTNGDLYLGVADGYNLVFGDHLSAWGNVIRDVMQNNVASAGNDNGGTVMIPTTSNGCATQMANLASASPSSTCIDAASSSAFGNYTSGSVLGGHASTQNTSTWQNVSLGTYNSFLIDGNGLPGGTQPGTNNTGATDMTLPFVSGTASSANQTTTSQQQVQIIRRPPAGEAISSMLGSSRLANEAQIRILLSDNQADLHLSDWNGNPAQDYQLVGPLPTALAALPQGASSGGTQPTAGITVGSHTYYFAESWCDGTTRYTNSTYPSGRICPSTGDQSFIVPSIYGPVSNGPGGAAMTPTAFPAPTAFTTADNSTNGLEWPLVNGWLLVEVKWASDQKWHGVTSEWLGLGFARGLQVPTSPGTPYVAPSSNAEGVYGSNSIQDHANAILYFQETADRNGNNSVSGSTDMPVTTNPYGSGSQYNYYPINLYDAREGENNDGLNPTLGTGTANGVMNVVELDVGNLRNWLLGLTGSTGANVDYATQNGYILYFSDRRGMQFATATQGGNYATFYGEYGFEDTVNYLNSGSNFMPDGRLDSTNYNGISPEDLNGNLLLDNYGVKYVGDAWGTQITTDTDTTSPPNPYHTRFNTYTYGRANRVTGARHALKLVDGSLGNLPTMPSGSGCVQSSTNPTACGGFTVASENPVYIQGNYNSNCPAAVAGSFSPCTPGNTKYDQTWTSTTASEPNHAAASVIADAVTLLSNNWQDDGCTSCSSALINTTGSLVNPFNPGNQTNPATAPNRMAVTTYYRTAIAAGKTIAFANTAQNPTFAFGTDGGVHNFLRFLEDWGGIPSTYGGTGSQQQLYYKGSIVSLYWTYYATGTFKCCGLVYNPPDRQYTFDSLFSVPQNLPPGTPMFRNVDNLSYRQNQVARTN